MHTDTAATPQLTAFAGQQKVASGTLHAMAQVRAALEARQLELSETTPGTWQIRRKATPKPSAKA